MNLFFRKLGNGKPLFILHGLFGSSDNWQTLGTKFAEHFTVYLIDQRNHGRSPHSNEFNYAVMSEDLLELADSEKIERLLLLGHSMGGKTAMQFAVTHPERVEKIVVVDIGPKKYPVTNRDVINALEKVDLQSVKSRKEVESVLSQYMNDIITLQFLLKNLYWNESQKLDWRFNLEAIKKNISLVSEPTPIPEYPIELPVLFVKGEKSDYIVPDDDKLIHSIFPQAQIKTIAGAGHWVHADKPQDFFNIVTGFFLNEL